MPGRALVLDANILVRAVLGNRVRQIIEIHTDTVSFFVPEAAYHDAEEHVPKLVARRGGDPQKALVFLQALVAAVELIPEDAYREYEVEAKKRLAKRDLDDWPILATALALGCPIWTEDTDFFGCGVGTWTTDRVELFCRE
jgi:predicted nucleic acid-binding protein